MQQLDTARDAAIERLRRLGYSSDDAAVLADHFVDADARGKRTHGVVRIDWLESLPDLSPDARPRRTVATPSFERWDGEGVVGYLTMAAICEAVLADPPECSRLIVASDTAPVGVLGYWVRRLMPAGLTAVMTATSPPRLASPDGGPALAGTNPIAIGIPSSDGRPLITDVAMAAATHGHVLLGLAEESDIVPFGGDQAHKAFALAVALQGLVEALVGHEGNGVVLLVARAEGDPVPSFRVRAPGIRLPGDS